jgi:hypothetical protein
VSKHQTDLDHHHVGAWRRADAAAQYVKPVSPGADDVAKYNMASTEARRSFFAAAMSGLTPDQLQTFWAVYSDYEKEKDALAMARTDLAKK